MVSNARRYSPAKMPKKQPPATGTGQCAAAGAAIRNVNCWHCSRMGFRHFLILNPPSTGIYQPTTAGSVNHHLMGESAPFAIYRRQRRQTVAKPLSVKVRRYVTTIHFECKACSRCRRTLHRCHGCSGGQKKSKNRKQPPTPASCTIL
jgi:hypothetical protein